MGIDLRADLVNLLCTIVDIESVSGNEVQLADVIAESLRPWPHLEVIRDGNCVVAKTNLGRKERVVIAGHLDTVPVTNNLPSWTKKSGNDTLIYGRGSCDMKGGVAVALSCSVDMVNPNRDITWVFYDNEEVASNLNGLERLSQTRHELLQGDFAVLMEPTAAQLEGGCQGTIRILVKSKGVAAHSARSWLGDNAIHKITKIVANLPAQPTEVEVDGLKYRPGINAVQISGGIAGNVIPDSCEVQINYRFAPNKSAEVALKELYELFNGFEIEELDVSAGARPGLDHLVAKDLVKAIGTAPRAKYGWTDVARFSKLGIPAVNFGPGDPNKAHTADEYCSAKDLYTCTEVLHRWLEG